MSDSACEFFFYFSKKLGWSSDGMQKKYIGMALALE